MGTGADAIIASTARASKVLKQAPYTELGRAPGTRSVSHGLAYARALTYRVVRTWWRIITSRENVAEPVRELFHGIELVGLADSDTEAADELAQACATLPPDAGAYQIGLAYTRALPKEHRAAHGVYYTPPSLAQRLIDQATTAGVDWATARVLDPACGGGAFLAPVAQRILAELRDCSPRILVKNIAARLQGFEIDPFGAWLSQVALDAVFLPLIKETGKRLPVVVTVCDSLRENPLLEEFDLVIGNPPYGRTRLDPPTRLLYQRSLYGHANLYGLFTDLALRHTRHGGVIAFVTPASFLAGEYFKRLRALLACEAPLTAIDFIAARKGVFESVLQETVLATYRRGARSGRIKVHEISSSHAETLTIEKAGSTELPADRSEPWLLPRQSQEVSLVARLTKLRCRLVDWGYAVSTGPLVWNRYKDQLAIRPGAKRFPLVWAESVTSDGKFVWRANKKNHAPYFEVRRGDDWLLTNSVCVLVQRTTAKEQNRRLIAAALPSSFAFRHGAVVIENHLNMVRPIVKRPPVSVEVLAEFLNSGVADRVFRCVSGSVAVSAYELESLPLPEPEQMAELDRLFRNGAPPDRIKFACERLYGEAA